MVTLTFEVKAVGYDAAIKKAYRLVGITCGWSKWRGLAGERSGFESGCIHDAKITAAGQEYETVCEVRLTKTKTDRTYRVTIEVPGLDEEAAGGADRTESAD